MRPTGESPLCQPNRILVVHDDGDIRQLSAEPLTRSGYDVDIATDGATAWQALGTATYDLLITNCELSKVSGAELLTLHLVLAGGLRWCIFTLV